MADTVRYLLEEMVPELEALEERGYFSRSEIRSIVQRRQDFEYALKRMAAVKADYLRYIEYEGRLEELRACRRSSRGITGKKGLADFCIVRRIHFIYERATRKFRGDLDLWSRWLRFCQRTGSSRQMSRVLTKALQLHSGCAPLWTYAAAWEFEHNLNAAAARALMQRGLRMCKDSPSLWHEYFRMELLYALRLRERRRVLGIDAGDDDLRLGGDGGGSASGVDGDGEEDGAAGDESGAAVAAVLNGAVAVVVYKSAIAAVPASVPFRRKFLDILHPMPQFPGKAALEDAVYSSVANDFGGSPEATDLLARRHVAGLSAGAAPAARATAMQVAVAEYERGLEAAPSTELVALLLAFLQEQMQALQAAEEAAAQQEGPLGSGKGAQQQQSELAVEAAQAAEWVRLQSQRAFEEADAAGLLSEALRLDSIAFFLHHGDTGRALAAAQSAVRASPQSAALWQQLLELEAVMAAAQLVAGGAGSGSAQQPADSSNSSSDDEEERANGRQATAAQQRLEELALKALRAVPAADAVPVWLVAISVLCGAGCSLHALSRQLLEAALRQAKGPVEGGLGAVAATLLTALQRTGGIGAARSLYRSLLPLPPPGGDFFRCLLELEMEQQQQRQQAMASSATTHSPAAAAAALLNARQLQDLFETATDAYGAHDVDLWLLYAAWEAGRGGNAGVVYWKACKALREPERFAAAYQLRFKIKPTV